MKRLSNIAVLCTTLLATLCLAACDGPKAIPDKDLVKIFHDAFLANAYVVECKTNEDSLLLYEPILARYGYTVEDMRHTVSTIASRKSSRLSDLVGDASTMLEEESKMYNYQLRVLDTVDNVAKRKYTRVMHSDSLIRVRRISDSTKLQITLKDIVPGEYSVEFEYYIDTTDENRNSRIEAYLKLNDGTQAHRHTMMLSRYRDAKYQRKFTADSIHRELHINLYFHNKNEEHKKPGITIRNLTITRVLPNEQALDSLFEEQMGPMIFNHKFLSTGQIPKRNATTAKPANKAKTKQEAKPKNGAKPKSEAKPKHTQTTKPKAEASAKNGTKPTAKPAAKPKSSTQKPATKTDSKAKSSTPKRVGVSKPVKKQNS